MTKSLRGQFRDLERNLTKEMNKTVKNVNRKMARNPIKLPVESKLAEDGVTVQHIDNSVHISGDVTHSQIGGTGHFQINVNESNIEGILTEIKEFSKSLNEYEKETLTNVLEELQDNGEVVSNMGKAFLEKHPLISMGIVATIEWGATAGLDRLVPIIQNIFS